jgi:hypothetical protein
MTGDAQDLARWRTWWRRTNVEHFASFYLVTLLTLALFCLLAPALLEPGAPLGEDLDFLRAEAATIEARFGAAARHAFLVLGFAVLFSTELALLDAVARVAADLLVLRLGGRVTISWLYFAVVWAMIGFGIAVLFAGFVQPLSLLVLSAALNAVVMFLYSGLLLWLNWRTFAPPLRPSPLRVAALLVSTAFFGYFSALTLADQLGWL